MYIYVCAKKHTKICLVETCFFYPWLNQLDPTSTNLSQNKIEKDKTHKFSGFIIISILFFFMAQLYGWLAELERFLKNDA